MWQFCMRACTCSWYLSRSCESASESMLLACQLKLVWYFVRLHAYARVNEDYLQLQLYRQSSRDIVHIQELSPVAALVHNFATC